MKAETMSIQDEIDLLVDGELPEERRAGLFARMEDDPRQWRSCALSFLESQTLAESLLERDEKAHPKETRFWWRPLAVAALVIFAFTLGRGWQSGRDQGGLVERPTPGKGLSSLDLSLARDSMFRLARSETGAVVHTTLEPLPEVVLQSLVQSGHQVRLVEQMMELEDSDGGTMSLPVVETQIIDMRPLEL